MLKSNHIKTLIDIRLNNTFQLAGYAKRKICLTSSKRYAGQNTGIFCSSP